METPELCPHRRAEEEPREGAAGGRPARGGEKVLPRNRSGKTTFVLHFWPPRLRKCISVCQPPRLQCEQRDGSEQRGRGGGEGSEGGHTSDVSSTRCS